VLILTLLLNINETIIYNIGNILCIACLNFILTHVLPFMSICNHVKNIFFTGLSFVPPATSPPPSVTTRTTTSTPDDNGRNPTRRLLITMKRFTTYYPNTATKAAGTTGTPEMEMHPAPKTPPAAPNPTPSGV
jgi:hypothetical protein